MADSSRIFVRNIPPSFKEDDFRKHFAQLAPITDAKFIPRRHIGYVGYKTHDAAVKAVKYYNRSFIRMSRINVELARPVGEVEPRVKPRQNFDAAPVYNDRPLVPKTETPNPKLQEFLKVMAPSSKSKTWANEDDLPTGEAVPEPAPAPAEDAAEASEGEYQTLSKKRKRSVDNVVDATEGPNKALRVSPVKQTDSKSRSASPSGGEPAEPASIEQEPSADGEQPAPAVVSDNDWLRSKTSRLLGLVDDEEMEVIEDKELQRPSKKDSSDEDVEDAEDADYPDESERPLPQPDAEPSIDPVSQKEAQTGGKPPDPPDLQNADTGRLFVRNLSYEASEDDLRAHFSGFGTIEEVHISRDTRSGASKGFGYLQFASPDEAMAALAAADGKPFQGRLLHVLPAAAKKEHGLDEFAISKLPLKKQREIRKKAEASSATFRWNSMYMNPDAILSSISTRLGVSKADILDPTSTDAAIKQAHAETNVIQETKTYFASHGVDLESFKGREFNDKAILVKNFPYGTTGEEIKQLFETYGTVSRLLMPPSATIAIVEMEQPTQARSAFGSLAYRKFKDSVLFLEKAPKGVFSGQVVPAEPVKAADTQKPSTSELLQQPDSEEPTVTSTLFVRNLNFSTTSTELRDLFRPLNGFLSATVKTKTDPKKPGQVLSMGFGFVEFKTKQDAQSALAAMNGYRLAGHDLIIKESHKALDAAEERRREDAAKKLASRRTKIIIKNLPFEATKKDVRALFGPYGQLRSVRVPKKFDSSSRGFAFADFVTTREAENAMKALSGVHLLGRRLNLDFAAGDSIDPEEEIEKMAKKVGKQADRVAIQKLTGGGRKKFSVHQGEDADVE